MSGSSNEAELVVGGGGFVTFVGCLDEPRAPVCPLGVQTYIGT